MDIDQILKDTTDHMKKAVVHCEGELLKIRAGKASPNMLEDIKVDYYGMPTPLLQAANVSNIDSRTLSIMPYEKAMLAPIEKAIFQSNIGVTPSNDGIIIRIFMPPLTEERRKEYVKKAHAEGETGKISIRNIRRDSIEHIKKLQKDGMSEDACKDGEARVQQVTDKMIATIESLCQDKEKELMTV